MDWLQIIFLSLVQGITEFLPISSSAHLILPAELGAWSDQGLAFDVAVHLGTLSAVCLYFRRDLLTYVTGTASLLRHRRREPAVDEMLKVGAATVPIVVAGVLLKDTAEHAWRQIEVIAATTIGFGLLLGYADRVHGEQTAVGWRVALLIGAAQVLALVPGTSRSGITITAALLLGLSRTAAARFSFLLSIPTIAGAGALTGFDLLAQPEPARWSELIAGGALAGISAYLCIATFLALVERTGMLPYVIYRLVLGAALIWIAW